MLGLSDDDPLGVSGSILILKVEEKQNGRLIYPSFSMTERQGKKRNAKDIPAT